MDLRFEIRNLLFYDKGRNLYLHSNACNLLAQNDRPVIVIQRKKYMYNENSHVKLMGI